MFQYVKKTGAYIYILCSSASLVGKLDNIINKYCGTWKVGTPTKVSNNNNSNNNSAMTNILTDAVVCIMGQLRFIKDNHMWYLWNNEVLTEQFAMVLPRASRHVYTA